MKIKPIFILSILIVLIATLTPGNGKIAGNYLDKVAHFGIFAFMTFYSLKAVSNKKYIPEVLIVCVFLGFLTEILQQFIPGRNLDFYDALADIIGVASALFYYNWTQRQP